MKFLFYTVVILGIFACVVIAIGDEACSDDECGDDAVCICQGR